MKKKLNNEFIFGIKKTIKNYTVFFTIFYLRKQHLKFMAN